MNHPILPQPAPLRLERCGTDSLTHLFPMALVNILILVSSLHVWDLDLEFPLTTNRTLPEAEN